MGSGALKESWRSPGLAAAVSIFLLSSGLSIRMRGLAERTGFRVAQLRYMNIVGFFGWWVNARVLRKTEQSEGQIALFDKMIVPLQAAMERWIEPPCGQSIFAVLEK